MRGQDALRLVLLEIVPGVADQPDEVPRRLIVRTVLVHHVGPRKQRAGAGTGLPAGQRVDFEGDVVRRVLLHPAEEPRLAENRGGALLTERVLRCRKREARDLVLVHEVSVERERGDHLGAVREAGHSLEIGREHARAERVGEWQELVRDADGMPLLSEREPDPGRLTSGVEHGELLHRRQPVVERLRRSLRIEARLLELIDVDVHLLEVAVLDRRAVAHALPLADGDHVFRQVLVPGLREVGGHPIAEVVLAAPVVRHAHEDVGRAALAHQRREVFRLVPLVGHRDHLDLVTRPLREVLATRFVEPVAPADQLGSSADRQLERLSARVLREVRVVSVDFGPLRPEGRRDDEPAEGTVDEKGRWSRARLLRAGARSGALLGCRGEWRHLGRFGLSGVHSFC